MKMHGSHSTPTCALKTAKNVPKLRICTRHIRVFQTSQFEVQLRPQLRSKFELEIFRASWMSSRGTSSPNFPKPIWGSRSASWDKNISG
jgi:hypothetical protein